MNPVDASTAAVAYEASREAFARGDHAAALAAIRAAITADRGFPNAHNFAGWILIRLPARTPADVEAAIDHFRAAIEVAPDDPVPLANLCDALVVAGRDAEAFAEAERATAVTSSWDRMAAAHNWLGWQLTNRPEMLDRAIGHFQQAIHWRPRWGVARANLGKALELAHRADDAYEQHSSALECEDDFDRAFCHERIGAYQARHGWFRNALTSMRIALHEDEKRGGARRAPYTEGIRWIEQQLRAAGIEPPPEGKHERDRAWLRACELEVPPRFLAKNELGEPLGDDVIEVERLARAERWSDVVSQLAKLRADNYNKLWDAVGFAERAAERAHVSGHGEAIAIMRFVVDAYTYYASGATSGAEGLGRMSEVERVRAKLAAWERDV